MRVVLAGLLIVLVSTSVASASPGPLEDVVDQAPGDSGDGTKVPIDDPEHFPECMPQASTEGDDIKVTCYPDPHYPPTPGGLAEFVNETKGELPPTPPPPPLPPLPPIGDDEDNETVPTEEIPVPPTPPSEGPEAERQDVDRVVVEVPDLEGAVPNVNVRKAEIEPAPPSGGEEPMPSAQEEATPLAQAAPVMPATGSPLTTLLITGTGLLGAASGLALIPGWRRWIVRLFSGLSPATLYSRLTKADALSHPKRNLIMEFVRQNPGARLEVARRELGLSNGTMRHHLKILNANDLVRVRRSDGAARLFLAGPVVDAPPTAPPLRQKIVQLVQSSPGLTQRDIARASGQSERVVSYHVAQLKGMGSVTIERQGAANRCFPAASGARF